MVKKNIEYKTIKDSYHIYKNRKNRYSKTYKKYLKVVKTNKYADKWSSKKNLTKRKNIRRNKNSSIKHSYTLKGGNIFASSVPRRIGISPAEMKIREEERKRVAAEKLAAIKAAVLKSTQPTLPTTPKMNVKQLLSRVLQHTSDLGSPVQPIHHIQSILPMQSTPVITPVPVQHQIHIPTLKPGKF